MSKLFSFFLAADASLQVLMYSVFHVILLQEQGCCELVLGLMVSQRFLCDPKTGRKFPLGQNQISY